jgi:hypothetical protein
MIELLFQINGIYDILCALSIMRIIRIPILNKLHLSMFKRYHIENRLFERSLAYYIFMNGVIRLSKCGSLITMSYYCEATFFLLEIMQNSVYIDKALFVVVTSLFLGHVSNLYQHDHKYYDHGLIDNLT